MTAPEASRPWRVRRFSVAALDPGGVLAREGRRIKPGARAFPFELQRVSETFDLGRITGPVPVHTDRLSDQRRGGAFYPFHQGMIWTFVLWARGDPALLLVGRTGPRLIRLEPGVAIWFDITETAHGVTALPEIHPKHLPQAVIAQACGCPAFLYDAAVQELRAAVQEFAR
ncbi:hypothetical protein [Elstera sp.]|jgi:hypothetical protein|uniref:hypothetical protein n=1 Tax=Elstera sp. TaxID=1916664 RepID=UPI0037BEEA7A